MARWGLVWRKLAVGCEDNDEAEMLLPEEVCAMLEGV